MALKSVTPGQAQKVFYTEAPWYIKIAQVYVWGDAIVILPFLIGLVVFGYVVSWSYALFAVCVFYATRQLGEMVYWLLQQFGDHSYRPWDVGLHKLSTHSIYIVYQVHACVQAVVGIVGAVFVYTEYILH